MRREVNSHGETTGAAQNRNATGSKRIFDQLPIGEAQPGMMIGDSNHDPSPQFGILQLFGNVLQSDFLVRCQAKRMVYHQMIRSGLRSLPGTAEYERRTTARMFGYDFKQFVIQVQIESKGCRVWVAIVPDHVFVDLDRTARFGDAVGGKFIKISEATHNHSNRPTYRNKSYCLPRPTQPDRLRSEP